MPLVRSALIATAACLFGAAAYAQPTTDQSAAPPAASSDMSSAPAAPTTPAMPDAAPATSAAPDTGSPSTTGAMPAPAAPTGAAANTSTTVGPNGTEVVASQPVPDTPANRHAYGTPLSHAGKHTAPKGN